MTTVALTVEGSAAEPMRRKRLGVSFAASALVHVLVVVVLAGLLKPFPIPILSRLGDPAPMEVAIVGVPPVAYAPPLETPAPTAELPATPPPPELAPPPKPRLPPDPLPPPMPIPTPPARPSVAMPPLGVSVQADASADALPANAPLPQGDVSVGAVQNGDRIGHTQSLRLAQRFPTQVSQAPRLRDPLVVAYPPDAARAHTEARIAALLIVDADGKIVETTLYPEESEFGPFVQNSLNNARFTPAETNAKPVPYWTILEFIFTMRRAAPLKQP